MFLNELGKKEGIALLQLLSQLANADGDFSSEEKALYKEYLEELNVKESEVPDSKLDDVVIVLKDSSVRNKNIIYFELVGLALVDGVFDEREQAFLNELGNKLAIQGSKRLAFVDYFGNSLVRIKYSTKDAETDIAVLREQAEALLK